jgi:MerR family transcriptional regulator, light-induced transcriptional regulator
MDTKQVRNGPVGVGHWGQARDPHAGAPESRQGFAQTVGTTPAEHAVWSGPLAHELIPRLVKAHRDPAGEPETVSCESQRDASAATSQAPADVAPTPHVMELCRLVRLRDEQPAEAWIDELLTTQTDPERLMLELLAPAARHLGKLWEEDLADFAEVTVSVWRLEKLLRRIAAHPDIVRRPLRSPRRALLLPAPGEQHTFGLSMVGQFFRQAGWEVRHLTPEPRAALMDTLREDWFDVVGLSGSCEKKLDTLQSTVQDIRRASRNRSIRIIVGGHCFNLQPSLAAAIGADAAALDARRAVELAESLVSVTSRYA